MTGFGNTVASSPGLREGEEREGLVSTACACTIIMQILNNPITYGYCLVYLPFDLNFSRSNLPRNDSLDSSSFEREFEVTRETLPYRFMKASEQRGRSFSASTSAKVRRSSRIL